MVITYFRSSINITLSASFIEDIWNLLSEVVIEQKRGRIKPKHLEKSHAFNT